MSVRWCNPQRGPSGLTARSAEAAGADRVIAASDAEFPIGARGVSGIPEQLHLRGQGLPDAPCVAIVGARAASKAGVERAQDLARELAGAGVAVVSGGAIGIDAAAHRGALAVGGYTAAVMPCGLDQLYPARNHSLFQDIVDNGGGLFSGFAPGVPPRRFQFVRRNRLVAAVADAVVVVEAAASSGAFHTIAAADQLGRVCGAVPGSPGCEALIAQGAAVVTGAADVQAALAGSPVRPSIDLPAEGSREAALLAALRAEARTVEELAADTGLEARGLSRALMGLELQGLAVLVPGRAYVRSALAEELMAN